MPVEPKVKRTIAFFDGQNLFHHARDAFGYNYPNYSPLSLAARVCSENGYNLHEIRFYTGINQTDWIRIDQATYDACIDPRDYRRKPKSSSGD